MKKISFFSLDIPITGKYNIEMVENSRLLICGCVGVASYTRECARICTREDDIIISGCGLSLCWAGEGKMLISGDLRTVTFEKGVKK
ncbi:MAG: YabP/YqfC family sporulation protein [Ruminococcus sp.]|nr:YabP/YqfC family sporulation protein [Candidatus Apopatosoma intestinale]